MTCNLEVPVLLGPPQAIGGKPLAVEPIDEEYMSEVSRGPALEEGRGNLGATNGVANAVLYAGRYNGLMVFVPVSNVWVGVEGDIIHVKEEGR